MKNFWVSFGLVKVVFALCFLDGKAAANPPRFITPCDSRSPQCLKRAIQTALPAFIQGVPALGMKSLDPFIIDNLRLMLPGGLKMDFRRGVVKGLRNCLVESALWVDDLLDLQFRCNITIKGKYKSSGKLLMFSIDGDGDSMIKCRDLGIQYTMHLGSSEGVDGEGHIEVKSISAKYTYHGRVSYRLTNLLKGNPAISNLVVEFLNRNWKMVAEEFGDPIMNFGMENILSNIKKLFMAVPMDQLIGFRMEDRF